MCLDQLLEKIFEGLYPIIKCYLRLAGSKGGGTASSVGVNGSYVNTRAQEKQENDQKQKKTTTKKVK